MNTLFGEAADYIRYEWTEFEETLKPHHIRKAVVPYAEYLKALTPAEKVSDELLRYINKPLMLYDKYINNEIQVFLYDPKDDNASFFSDSELDDATEDELDFVNGVKVCDEFDFREQITANKFTGGFWDPEIHWVVERKRLKKVIEEEKKAD
jgi:hypothetical protein